MKALRKPGDGATPGGAGWTFLTNHAHVLLCLARRSDALMRDVAADVGITERAVQKIVRELADDGYLERVRDGRRNRYVVRGERPFRHPLEAGHAIGELLGLLSPGAAPRRQRSGHRQSTRQ